MRLHKFVLCLLACAVQAVPIHALAQTTASRSFECPQGARDTPQGRAYEAKLMAGTHGMASRPSKHLLQLNVAGKTLSFRDEPADMPNNIAYFFCASHDGYALIEWADGPTITGKLVDERNGDILPGGLLVLFSPDGRAYLTVHHEDASLGDTWTIYRADGRRSWQEINYVLLDPRNDPDNYVELARPAWTPNGELTARAYDADAAPIAKLIKANGRWSWHLMKSAQPTH